MHNDVLVLKDVLGYLGGLMGDAVAVGHLGQCWNCPAHVEELTREVMGCKPCGPERYMDFRPDYNQLQKLVLPGFPWVTPVRNWPGRGLDRHRRSRWLS